jgi:hypothetical protein
MTAINPEIIPNNERVRLYKNRTENSLYTSQKDLTERLKRKAQTLRTWVNLLITHVDSFWKYYKPRKAYCDYVVWCIERIDEYDKKQCKSAPRPDIIEDFIVNNSQSLTIKKYLEELENVCTTESKIDNSKLIKAA